MVNTLTINPAIDRLLFIQQFSKNNTNRIQRVVEVLGGKGTHVSLNLSALGIQNRSFGVTMGETGRRIFQILEKEQNIAVQMLQYDFGCSRTNYVLIEDDHTCSLIAEKGETLSEDICQDLLARLEAQIRQGDTLVLSGDATNAGIPFFYNVIMNRLRARNIKVFLDTSSECLREALKAQPYLVKPNTDELSQLIGTSVNNEHDILRGMDFIAESGVEIIAVSCGAEGSYVRRKGETYRVFAAPNVAVVNTIGCGDAYLSGLICGISRQMPFEKILQFATAVSAATAESELTAGFQMERVNQLSDDVRVIRL